MKSEIFNKFLYISPLPFAHLLYFYFSSYISHFVTHSLSHSTILRFYLFHSLPSSLLLSFYIALSPSLSLALSRALLLSLSFNLSLPSLQISLSLSLSVSLSFRMFISFCSSPQQPFLTFLKKIPASYRELHSWNILCQSSVEVPAHALEPPKK